MIFDAHCFSHNFTYYFYISECNEEYEKEKKVKRIPT